MVKLKDDKLLHFAFSAMIMFVFYALTECIVSSAIATLTIGVLKEVYDEYDYGGWDWWDILADLSGIVLAGGILIASDILHKYYFL